MTRSAPECRRSRSALTPAAPQVFGVLMETMEYLNALPVKSSWARCNSAAPRLTPARPLRGRASDFPDRGLLQ